MSDKKESLFRKNALEQINSPKAMDDLIRVVSAKSWLILLAFALILVLGIFWVVFGTIVTRIDGQGILLAEADSLSSIVAPEQGGYVRSLKVHVGDKVKRGMLIAKLESPVLFNEIKTTENYIKLLDTLYTKLAKSANNDITKRRMDFEEKMRMLNSIIKVGLQKQSSLLELLQAKRKAFKMRVIGRETLTRTQMKYFELQQNISKNKNSLISLKLELAKFIDTWQERLRTLKLKIDEQQAKLTVLQGKALLATNITSPVNGVVTSVHVKVGDYISRGKVIMNISSGASTLEAIVYIPAQESKHVRTGMQAQVVPSNVRKIEYGGIVGKVIAVSSFPSTPQSMMNILKNQNLVDTFLKKGPVILVRIQLIKNKENISGYRWTSSDGPSHLITQGTLINVSITTQKQTPISLFLPKVESMISDDN